MECNGEHIKRPGDHEGRPLMVSADRADRREADSRLVTRNSIVLLGRYFSVWGLSMVLVLFLPRYLGAQGLGQLQFAQSFVSLFAVGIGLGTGNYLIKEVARDRSQLAKFLGSAVGLQAITACAVLSIIAVFTELSGHSETARQVVYLLAFWMLVTAFGRLMVTFLHGFETMGKASIAEIANKTFVAAVGVGLLVQGGGVVAFAAVLVAGAFVELLIAARFVSKLTPLRMNLDRQRMRVLIRGGTPFLMLGVLLSLYMHTDVVMLRFLTNEDVVGWHAAAFRIFGSLEFLPAMLTAALLPTLARMYKARAAHAGIIASRSLGVVLLLMVPVGLGLSLTASEVIAFMPYPDTFSNTVPVLTLLALSSPVTAVLIVFGAIAAAVDRQRAWAYAMAGGLVLNVALNFAAIQYFQDVYGNGGIGASVATLVSESVMVLVGIWIVPKDLFTRRLASTFVKVAVCSGAMTLAVLMGKSADLGLLPLMGIGAAAYGSLAFAMRAVTPGDIAFLWTSVAQRNQAATAAPHIS